MLHFGFDISWFSYLWFFSHLFVFIPSFYSLSLFIALCSFKFIFRLNDDFKKVILVL